MKGKLFAIFLLGIFMFSSVSAVIDCTPLSEDPFIQNSEVMLQQTCDSCSFVNITSLTYPNSTIIYPGVSMTKNDFNYNYSFNKTDLIGTYLYTVSGDKNGGSPQIETFCFYVSPNGQASQQNNSLNSLMFILITFVGLVLLLVWYTRRIDYDKWYANLVKKYGQRNFVKFAFGAVWYNVLKNMFLVYYLLGLIIITVVTDISVTYNLLSVKQILTIFLTIYIWGFILVLGVMIGNIHEWIVDFKKQLDDDNWGVGQE